MKKILLTLIIILFSSSLFAADEKPGRYFEDQPDVSKDPKDPTNNCLDVAIITAPEKRTKKTIKKLKTVAGRVLSK